MGYGHVGGAYDHCYEGGNGSKVSNFALLVVLFILLIIIGAHYFKY